MKEQSFNEAVTVLREKSFGTLIAAKGAAKRDGQNLIARACEAAIKQKLDGCQRNDVLDLSRC